MFIHYLKIAFRNLWKYKSQTLISVIGLAVGFTCFALATLWIRYEMTYDSFHKNAKQMYFLHHTMFSKEYFLLLLIGAIIAFSTSYSIMQRWLENYVKQISILAWVFLSIPFVLALMTVLSGGSGECINQVSKIRRKW